MGFMALAIGYVQRFCLSLAITEMAGSHHPLRNKTMGTECYNEHAFFNTTVTPKKVSTNIES